MPSMLSNQLKKMLQTDVFTSKYIVSSYNTALAGSYMTIGYIVDMYQVCLLYTSPSPRDGLLSRMPSSA